MKLKYLILAFVLPLSALADKTNLFDTVRVQQKLWVNTNNVPERLYIRGGAVFDAVDLTGNAFTITNAPTASNIPSINVFRSQNGRFFQANNSGGGASLMGYFDASFAGWGTVANHPFGVFINGGPNSFRINTSGNSVFSAANADSSTFTNGTLSVVGTSAAINVVNVVGASGQTANLQQWRNNAGTVLASINSTGALTVGISGSALTNNVTATASLNFPNILAAGSSDLTITVTGAAANDIVNIGRPTAEDSSLVTRAFVSSANTVTVRANNVGAVAVDQGALTYRVEVRQY